MNISSKPKTTHTTKHLSKSAQFNPYEISIRSFNEETGRRDRIYLEKVNDYFKIGDELILQMKKKSTARSNEIRTALGKRIEELKKKRVALKIKMDKAWRSLHKPWNLFIEEFEKENQGLIVEYQAAIRMFTIFVSMNFDE